MGLDDTERTSLFPDSIHHLGDTGVGGMGVRETGEGRRERQGWETGVRDRGGRNKSGRDDGRNRGKRNRGDRDIETYRAHREDERTEQHRT